jgi:hypothetical protein
LMLKLMLGRCSGFVSQHCLKIKWWRIGVNSTELRQTCIRRNAARRRSRLL